MPRLTPYAAQEIAMVSSTPAGSGFPIGLMPGALPSDQASRLTLYTTAVRLPLGHVQFTCLVMPNCAPVVLGHRHIRWLWSGQRRLTAPRKLRGLACAFARAVANLAFDRVGKVARNAAHVISCRRRLCPTLRVHDRKSPRPVSLDFRRINRDGRCQLRRRAPMVRGCAADPQAQR